MRTAEEQAIAAALIHLTAARDLLKAAKASKACAKVRAAITSTQGAQRHAQGLASSSVPVANMGRSIAA